MGELGDYLLLAGTATALWNAAWRVAARAGAAVLLTAIAAAVVFAAAATIGLLALGRVGLADDQWAIAAGAGAALFATRALTIAGPPVVPAFTAVIRSTEPRWLIALGVAAGAYLAWVAWLLHFPALGFDSGSYHLTEGVLWAQGGDTGSSSLIAEGYPYGAYPRSFEVLAAGALALSHSLISYSLLVASMMALLASAGWVVVRALGASRLTAALGVGAFCLLLPLAGWQEGGAVTDLASIAWLASCSALALHAVRGRPALLPLALLAGGLAIGTKTVTALVVLATLAWAVWALRAELRSLTLPLALAGVALVIAGGGWYIENTLAHGWPLWPFTAAPWGDPVPPLIDSIDVSLISAPAETISRVGSGVAERFAAGLLILFAGAAPALVSRRRALRAGGALVVLSVLIWLLSPFTGVTDDRTFDSSALSTYRYLLPATALGVALLCAVRGRGRALADGVLAIALGTGLVEGLAFGLPAFPSGVILVTGAAAGALLGYAAVVLVRRGFAVDGHPGAIGLTAVAAVVVGLVAALAIATPGYEGRYAGTGSRGAELIGWMASEPALDGEITIAIGPQTLAPVAGARLQHRLEVLTPDETCMRATGENPDWLIVIESPFSPPCPRTAFAAFASPGFIAYPPTN